MERIWNIINSDDFNFDLTNLLIDLYSKESLKYFKQLYFDEEFIDSLNHQQKNNLTKLAAVIEYIGNRTDNSVIYDWVYSSKLKLEDPYTPGLIEKDIHRLKRIMSAPVEFSNRNVFYDEETLKPI